MLRYLAQLVTALVLLANGQADAASLVPAGLWQSSQEGLVIRIERCGSGLCGFVAGIPASNRQRGSRSAGPRSSRIFVGTQTKRGGKV
jgi:hypothetical protein